MSPIGNIPAETFSATAPAVAAGAVTIPITSKIANITVTATTAITITTTNAVDGQALILRILDAGSVETLTFVNTENGNNAVPAFSRGSATIPLTCGFIFNGTTTKWTSMGAG